MNNKKKQILIIAMGNSIHTFRWVDLLSGMDFEIHLFNSFTVPFASYEINYPDGVKVFNFKTHIRQYIKILLFNILKYRKIILSFNLNILKSELMHDLNKQNTVKLAKIINKNDYILIHTLHTQTSAELLNNTLPLLKKECPVWINSVWGSDLFLHQWVSASRDKLVKLLPKIDYYWGEGRRDYSLARQLGFSGNFLPPIPAFGGFDINQILSIEYIPPSKRKKILVKGYQNVVGRASIAFHALEMCIDLLRDYEIIILSYENNIVPTIGEIFSQQFNIKVSAVSGVQYNDIIKIYSESRMSVALSTSDGLPASFIESMACGVFPIQSNTSMAYEWVDDGESAIFVSPGNTVEIACAVRKVLEDDGLVDKAAEINRSIIVEHFNNEKIKEKMSSIYSSIISGFHIADDAIENF